jgi:hypothetical protein
MLAGSLGLCCKAEQPRRSHHCCQRTSASGWQCVVGGGRKRKPDRRSGGGCPPSFLTDTPPIPCSKLQGVSGLPAHSPWVVGRNCSRGAAEGFLHDAAPPRKRVCRNLPTGAQGGLLSRRSGSRCGTQPPAHFFTFELTPNRNNRRGQRGQGWRVCRGRWAAMVIWEAAGRVGGDRWRWID